MNGISKILGSKENFSFEAKASQGGIPASLWETYSSFCNTEGGTIVLGAEELKDKTIHVIGLPNAYKTVVDFWNGVNDPNTVSENVLQNKDVTIETLDAKEIVVITIPVLPRYKKPIFIHNNLLHGTYKRDNEGDYPCTREEIQAMLRDQTALSLDFAPVEEKTLDSLDEDSISAFRNRFQSAKPNHVFLRYDEEDFLRQIKAAANDKDGKIRPTHAGLLMFGKWQEIVDFYPAFFLDYQDHREETPTVRWTDRIYSNEGNWSGNVCDFYFRVVPKLVADLPLPFKMKEDGVTRDDDTDLRKSVREALTNALVNADYDGRMGVVVKKYHDRFVFENPGLFRIPVKDAIKGGLSDPRNLAMMSIFNLVNVGEKQGGGIPLMFETAKGEGFPEPMIETRSDLGRTTITLFVSKPFTTQNTTQNTAQNTTQKEIGNPERTLLLLKENPSMTRAEIAKSLGITPDGAKFIIDSLKAQGRIKREGSDRKGKWIILK